MTEGFREKTKTKIGGHKLQWAVTGDTRSSFIPFIERFIGETHTEKSHDTTDNSILDKELHFTEHRRVTTKT